MREGAHLYRDLLDLNPPFVFWLHVPVVAAGEAAGLGPVLAFRLAVLAVIALGAWLTRRLLASSPLSTRSRDVLLFAFVFCALGIPLAYFGEREHLLFALVFPYVVLAAIRTGGAGAPRGLALATGVAAGVGVLLKPPAGLLLIGLAILVVAARRSLRPLLAAEVIAGAAVLGGGVLAVLAAAPEYLEAVRRYGPLYWEFSHRSVSVIAARDVHAWSIWLALAAAATTVWTLRARALALALAVAATALFCAVFVQGKAFGYHYFPAIGMSVSLLLLCLLGESRDGRSGSARLVASALALAATVGLFFLPAAARRAFGGKSEFERQASEGADALAAMPRGTTFVVLSSRLTDAYPAAVETGSRYVMRMPHLWFVPAVYPAAESMRVEPRAPAAMQGAERELHRMVGEDLDKHRPAIVLIRDPGPGERHAGDLMFDYLGYFCGDTAFARAFSSYRRERSVGGFDVFRRDASIRTGTCASS